MWILPVVVLALASAGASDDLPRSPLLAPASSWQKVAGGLGFGEGPAWHPDGYLLFEDVTNNRTLKLDAADRVSVFREGTDGANGLAFDGARWLVACEGNADGRGRRLVRIEKDGSLTVLVTFVALEEDPTNCTFGGPGRDVLYVTTTASLYRIRTTVRGQKSPPGK